jgi:hypothetical protein
VLSIGPDVEWLSSLDAPAHDVMECARRVDSSFSRHENSIARSPEALAI